MGVVATSQKRRRFARLWVGQRGMCAYCGREMVRARRCRDDYMATIEHIKPRAFGGTRGWDNIVLVHSMCNRERGCGPSRPFVIDLTPIGGRKPWRGHADA